MEDPYDTSYIASLGKGILLDIVFIFIFTVGYTIYNLVFQEKIVLPIEIISTQIFLLINFVILLCLVIYFIYKSKQII